MTDTSLPIESDHVTSSPGNCNRLSSIYTTSHVSHSVDIRIFSRLHRPSEAAPGTGAAVEWIALHSSLLASLPRHFASTL
jgi:hypothetical protein